jgi:hypothetical protein
MPILMNAIAFCSQAVEVPALTASFYCHIILRSVYLRFFAANTAAIWVVHCCVILAARG